MNNTCKKHNKPKNQVWEERQARGGSLIRVGCVDCREASENSPPRPRPPKRETSLFRRRF
jgi:hypothetical protein